ncbi:MAG: Ppx/GppA phosphatase family protein [Pseudomonadota bacterium]
MPVYAAVDLGTNNCRLLIARQASDTFRVIDAFSRTVRLGAGVKAHGTLSDRAMQRTIDALKICASKIKRRQATHVRAIATEACRLASNGEAFLQRVKSETDIDLEIITPAEEAELAAAGCAPLVDPACDVALVFDIGGGSTELIWLDLTVATAPGEALPIAAWTSLPVGVVTLSERYRGKPNGPTTSTERAAAPGGFEDPAIFEQMVSEVRSLIRDFAGAEAFRPAFDRARAHLIGNSGTVTTLAGVHLDLDRYDRDRVDGAWLNLADLTALTADLQAMGARGRARHPCIGADRADLLVPGCAILQAIQAEWPAKRVRVADRGLREGMLLDLMQRGRSSRVVPPRARLNAAEPAPPRRRR